MLWDKLLILKCSFKSFPESIVVFSRFIMFMNLFLNHYFTAWYADYIKLTVKKYLTLLIISVFHRVSGHILSQHLRVQQLFLHGETEALQSCIHTPTSARTGEEV